jgi:hypothetical protein
MSVSCNWTPAPPARLASILSDLLPANAMMAFLVTASHAPTSMNALLPPATTTAIRMQFVATSSVPSYALVSKDMRVMVCNAPTSMNALWERMIVLWRVLVAPIPLVLSAVLACQGTQDRVPIAPISANVRFICTTAICMRRASTMQDPLLAPAYPAGQEMALYARTLTSAQTL